MFDTATTEAKFREFETIIRRVCHAATRPDGSMDVPKLAIEIARASYDLGWTDATHAIAEMARVAKRA